MVQDADGKAGRSLRPARWAWTFLALVWAAPAASAPAREPTAHDPQFDHKPYWPDLTGREEFIAQEWQSARLLVWAHAGKAPKDADPTDAANWLEAGRPASAPPDRNTDILIPAGCQTPRAGPKGKGRLEARHVTVQDGASFGCPSFWVWGNLWLGRDAEFRGQSGSFKGTAHTFARGGSTDEPALLGHWVLIEKSQEGSVEFIGNLGTEDELKFNEGTAIVGPDSKVTAGPPSVQVIGPEAVLEIQSGGFFGKRANRFTDIDILVLGEVRAGSPRRPITRDAALGVSVKLAEQPVPRSSAQGALGKTVSASGLGRINATAAGVAAQTGNCGLLVAQGGGLRVYSQDPQKARLVIRWHGGERGHIPGGTPYAHLTIPESYEKLITMILLGRTQLDGVLFDNVAKGGIILPQPDVRSTWKHVFYGPGCAAAADELYAKYAGIELQIK